MDIQTTILGQQFSNIDELNLLFMKTLINILKTRIKRDLINQGFDVSDSLLYEFDSPNTCNKFQVL